MHVNDSLNDQRLLLAASETLTRWQRDQLTDGVEDARYQLAVRIFWLILGAACAAVGLVLLTILLK